MRILFVHGRSQGGKNPEVLKKIWIDALKKRLAEASLALPANVEIDFPFYGDVLDQFVEKFQLPADPAVAPKGSPVFDEYAEFRSQVVEEIKAQAGITDEEVAAEAGISVTEKGPQNWAWVQAIVRVLDTRVTGVSEFTIETFLRDVFLYSRRSAVQAKIDAIVADKLKDDTQVVVAHSLGTVVAYNVLRRGKMKPSLLVSLGSPLGIRALRPTLTPLSNPSGPKGWYNAYDKRDVVSLYPLDATNFGVNPAVANNGEVNNWTENHHGIIGYLDDFQVAQKIVTGLQKS